MNEPTGGEVLFDGKDVTKIKGKKEMSLFRHEVQMIFQDPYASLNPRMKVRYRAEGIDATGLALKHQKNVQKVDELLKPSDRTLHMVPVPHEFSGGQRQRIGIARALGNRTTLHYL